MASVASRVRGPFSSREVRLPSNLRIRVEPGRFRHDQWPWRSPDKTLRVRLEGCRKVALRTGAADFAKPLGQARVPPLQGRNGLRVS
jgi:hypothetical protein